MANVATLEARIDDLYKGPLGDFVASRTALARSLAGTEAGTVKTLRKPTLVPWVVNQLYWHARSSYDRLRSAGDTLRAGQIAALKGRSADVRAVGDAHRKALAGAVREALRLAAAAGVNPDADELTRTLEAVSLAQTLPEREGRLTKALQPAGFEALAGVAVKELNRTEGVRGKASEADEKARVEAARRRQRAVDAARRAVDRARDIEEQARAEWEQAKEKRRAAESELSKLESEGP